MKNVMYFSLFCKDKNSVEYYSMLYYALKTLEKYRPLSFDVVVFYSMPGVNFKKYKHLETQKIQKKFPWVRFIKSEYLDTDVHLHKWFNLPYVFNLGYEKVFYLDCDVVFLKDPNSIFEKYNEMGIYHMTEGLDSPVAKVLGYAGAASGQWIINKKTFSKTWNLYNYILINRQKLLEKSKVVLNREEAIWFATLVEQYAAQVTLKNQGIKSRQMDDSDVNWHKIFTYSSNGIKYTNNVIIAHYLGCNAHLVLPNNLLTKKLKQERMKVDKE